MTLSTRFDDLPDLVLIEIFCYLSSFNILWGFTYLNQRITSLLVERRYFGCVDLSPSRHFQFNKIVEEILVNKIECLTIDINASPLQLCYWPYLPRLSRLQLKGVRYYDDVIIFLLLHAATLTHLIIDTRFEFRSSGLSLKIFYPLCSITSLVKNIIFRHLHALQSLDLGTNDSNWICNWDLTKISIPLTFLRVVLNCPYDVIRLMLTRPLSETLKHLHITLIHSMCNSDVHLPNKDQLVAMKKLYTFTFVKSFLWKLKNELTFIDIITSADIMPLLRRINLSITLDNDEFNRIKQCSIFNDYRCVDVHFVLCINDYDANFRLTNLIPRGSLSYPREIMGSTFMFNYWHNIGYSTPVHLSQRSRYKFDRHWLWYTLPWSFEKFFQIPIINQCNHQRELYASPSSSNIIIPFNISTLNQQANILPLPKFYPVSSRVLEHESQSYHDIETTIRITIPPDRIIVIDCFQRLTDFKYTGNLRSVHILFYFSLAFPTINWNFLHTFSTLPLLKSLRITIYHSETVLEDEHCQVIVKRVPMLTDFVFCFRRYVVYCGDNDPFDIHRKSILNLYHHISILLFDQQPKIVIEADGCGLMMWL